MLDCSMMRKTSTVFHPLPILHDANGRSRGLIHSIFWLIADEAIGSLSSDRRLDDAPTQGVFEPP